MTITHPIPPGTSVRFKQTGKRVVVDGVVDSVKLLGRKTWMYGVKVGGKVWGVAGVQIAEESGRIYRGEDGWGE